MRSPKLAKEESGAPDIAEAQDDEQIHGIDVIDEPPDIFMLTCRASGPANVRKHTKLAVGEK